MNSRILKIFGIVVIVLIVLGAITALGAGAVYAASRFINNVSIVEDLDQEADPNAGVIIVSVDPDGPAAEAGVVRADILLEIDGEDINSTMEVASKVVEQEAGAVLELTVLHGDELRKFSVTLDERNGSAYLGISSCCGVEESRIHKQLSEIIPSIAPQTMIVEVVAGSPAEEAGLQKGDIILSVDGKELTQEYDLASAISQYSPGEEVTLEVKQSVESDPLEVQVVLSAKPKDSEKPYLGVSYKMTPALDLSKKGMPDPHFRFQPPGDHGVPSTPGTLPPFEFFNDENYEGIEYGALVVEVIDNSPASNAGVQSGDVITVIDGEAVDDPGSLAELIGTYNPDDEINVIIFRPGEENEIELQVTLGEHPDNAGKSYLGVFTFPIIKIDQLQNDGDSQGYGPQFFFKGLPLDQLPIDPNNLPHDMLPFDFQFKYTAPGENEV
jgi:S1-C subfamily serine protease